MIHTKRIHLVTVLLGLFLCALAQAQEWPQWRGPGADWRGGGLQAAGGVAGSAEAESGRSRPAPAMRHPSSSRGRVFLLSRMGEQESVSARDLGTGKEIWRAAYDAPYQMNPAATSHGKGPKSTPAHDRGRLFTFGIGGILSAWQAQDGRLLWRRDFKKEFPSTSPGFGVAMSPIVVGDLVIVHAGGDGNGAMLAMDVTTGTTKWSWKGDGPAYASPVVADLGGTRQIVTQSQKHVIGSVARRWPPAVGDPVRHRLRAEQRHADRREGPRRSTPASTSRRPPPASAWPRGSGRSRPCGRTPTCRCT